MNTENKQHYERINLLLTICNRGVADHIIKDLRDMGVTFNMTALGESIGGLGFADILGFADTETDIILSVVTDSKAEEAFALIEYGFSDPPDGNAACFLIPIEGVSGPLALEYMSGVSAVAD